MPKPFPFARFRLTYAEYRGLLTGLEPATFSRATIRRHLLPRVAARCRISLSKRISLLAFACCCCILRARWC
jgi:hypothetical protein